MPRVACAAAGMNVPFNGLDRTPFTVGDMNWELCGGWYVVLVNAPLLTRGLRGLILL